MVTPEDLPRARLRSPGTGLRVREAPNCP